MHRLTLSVVLVSLFVSHLHAAKGPEIIDPEIAKKDPDFLVQGEYVGEGNWPGKGKTTCAAQVIAESNHNFRVVVYRGGLPGDGWQRGDDRTTMNGELVDGEVTLRGKKFASGRIAGGSLFLSDSGSQEVAKLSRTDRKSATLGAEPPANAIVLFDGTNVDHFPGATLTEMKTLAAGCTVKENRKVKKLHIEFRLSWKPTARGQGRSNSGVYLGGLPEIQVLDSFGLEGARNECGAFYGRRLPDVNMCYPPLAWQTYDVEFSDPEVDNDGKPKSKIRATVRHNGVVIHESYETRDKTAPLRRLHLQKHGNQVQYRNIWYVEAK